MMNMNTDFSAARDAMLMQVNQASFAALDTSLYLDTHPCDSQALAYYNQMVNQTHNLKATYETQFGPLTASASSDTAYWSWVSDPWPWEGGCC